MLCGIPVMICVLGADLYNFRGWQNGFFRSLPGVLSIGAPWQHWIAEQAAASSRRSKHNTRLQFCNANVLPSSNWCNKWQRHPRITKQLTMRSNRIGTWYRQIRRYDCKNVAFMTTFRSEYFFSSPCVSQDVCGERPFYHATPFLYRLRMCRENQTKSNPQL